MYQYRKKYAVPTQSDSYYDEAKELTYAKGIKFVTVIKNN